MTELVALFCIVGGFILSLDNPFQGVVVFTLGIIAYKVSEIHEAIQKNNKRDAINEERFTAECNTPSVKSQKV